MALKAPLATVRLARGLPAYRGPDNTDNTLLARTRLRVLHIGHRGRVTDPTVQHSRGPRTQRTRDTRYVSACDAVVGEESSAPLGRRNIFIGA